MCQFVWGVPAKVPTVNDPSPASEIINLDCTPPLGHGESERTPIGFSSSRSNLRFLFWREAYIVPPVSSRI